MTVPALSLSARWRAWGALLRLSLAPSAAADVLAGCVWSGASLFNWRALPLVLASLCLYHGGMLLNDWADRAHDARTRPARPIPSGAVSVRAALFAAGTLLLCGTGLCFWLLPRDAHWLPLALAAAIVVYDLGPRGTRFGPLLLGACRGLNLALGIAAGAGLSSSALVPIGLYAVYVVCIGAIGRHEDAESESIDADLLSRWLVGAALALVGLALGVGAAPLGIGWHTLGRVLALAIAVTAAAPLAAAALRGVPWSRDEVLELMGRLLRRLLVCTAVLALSNGTPDAALCAALILLGYPLSFFLRRIFPPS